ncbi:MAG: xanthine dehydrogenase family protein subunit M [Caldilineaceae bacterium]|jgi:carbon-monoxide dehydrogenase medium subunit|nr:xanthine dehydrogenase family protein subunit M [Caldilineaceae bacterium]
MKPAPFAYFAPRSLDEALALLQEHGYEAKLLAGGQSLIPAMNFRLAQPAALIDINRIDALSFLEPASDGGLRIGAMTRQRTVERSALVAERAPLLHATMPFIAHMQIRNRGTLGGNLAHADPASELPAVMVALGARFRLQSQRGARWVNAADFYVGLFATTLEADEMLVEIAVPPLPPRTGWSIQEIARRRGDYAIVGVAATATLNADGRCHAARLVYLSVGEGPIQAHDAVAALHGQAPTAAVIAAAMRGASQRIEPLGDIHATPAYRRQLIEVLGRRALTEAFARVQPT